MKIKNVEFKARVESSDAYEQQLLPLSPVFKGLDHQVDTYFKVPVGRLKLREGNIEHALIQYMRSDYAGAKQSDVILYRHTPDPALKNILALQFGILKVVDKQRKIYFIDNVKFHFDKVEGLGEFMEVEAIDDKDAFTTEQLQQQCNHWAAFFSLKPEQFMTGSYSDML
jgi:predicted adenylyl cyclase CyaB